MIRLKFVFFLILILFFNSNCKFEQDNSSVLDFFWPLRVGNTFVYEGIDTVERAVVIDKVEKQDEKRIKVLTKEYIKKIGYSDTVEYRIDLRKNIIYKKNNKGGEDIFLKGPLEVGTKWSFLYTVVKAEGNNMDQSKSFNYKSNCRLEKKSNRFINQVNRDCIEAVCDMSESSTNSLSFVFCKKVGLYGIKMDDNEATWLEKLKKAEIKE